MKEGTPLTRKNVQFIKRQAEAGQLRYNDQAWMNNLVKSLAMDILNRMNTLEVLNKELDIVSDGKKADKAEK